MAYFITLPPLRLFNSIAFELGRIRTIELIPSFFHQYYNQLFFLETAVLIFIGAFLLTYLTIPKIIKVVEYKRLMDNPNQRSSHKNKTPTLGGVSFFYCLVFALFFIKDKASFEEAIYIIPGLTILFVVGLKDDLVVLSPGSKLIAQALAIIFVLVNPSFTIESLNGFLNIYEIPYYLYLIIAGFLMITIINFVQPNRWHRWVSIHRWYGNHDDIYHNILYVWRVFLCFNKYNNECLFNGVFWLQHLF